MSKKDQIKANETVNVENNEVTNAEVTNAEVTNAEAVDVTTTTPELDEAQNTEETVTPEIEKAERVLRAQLPMLRKHNLSFERRTNNFFTRMDVQATDKNGQPIYDEQGKIVMKTSRLVVYPYKVDEAGNDVLDEAGQPVLTDVFAEALKDVNIKRAANMIVKEAESVLKFDKEIAELQDQLDNKVAERAAFIDKVCEAKTMVMEFDLPEPTPAERVKASEVKAKLSAVEEYAKKAEEKNKALYAMLVAAGIPEEQIQAQLAALNA